MRRQITDHALLHAVDLACAVGVFAQCNHRTPADQSVEQLQFDGVRFGWVTSFQRMDILPELPLLLTGQMDLGCRCHWIPERHTVDPDLEIIEPCPAGAFQDAADADSRTRLGNLFAERDAMPLRCAPNAATQRVKRVEVVVLLLVDDHIQIGKAI